MYVVPSTTQSFLLIKNTQFYIQVYDLKLLHRGQANSTLGNDPYTPSTALPGSFHSEAFLLTSRSVLNTEQLIRAITAAELAN